MARRREDAIIALISPIFHPVIPGFRPVIPGFRPVIPGFRPVIPDFHPVIPAKAGIQRAVAKPSHPKSSMNINSVIPVKTGTADPFSLYGLILVSLPSLGARASRPRSRACARRTLTLALSHKGRGDPLAVIHT